MNRRPSLLLNYVISNDNVNEKRSRSQSVQSAAKVANARSALPSLRKDHGHGAKLLTGVALPPITVDKDGDNTDDSNGEGEITGDDVDVKNKIMMDLNGLVLDEKEKRLATSYRIQIWKLVFRCLGRTSLHGCPFLSQSIKSAVKITYWVALIMLSFTLMVYSLTAISVQFAERRTFLSSSNHFPKQLPFPAVTICNLNSFRSSAIPPNFTTDEVVLFLNSISAEPWLSDNFDVDGFIRKYEQVYGSDRAFLGNFGHLLENMLLTCYFESTPCDTSDFVTRVTSLGLCYTFNSGENQPVVYTDKYGYENGLRVTLNTEVYEYFTAEDDSTGFYVFVHNQGYVPYIGTNRGFTISSGQRTEIAVSKTDVYLLKPPYGECNDHVTLALFDEYSRESCLIECETNSAVGFCGCKAEFMPGNARICSLNETVRCLNVHSEQFEPQLCDCPVPCEAVLYDTKFSYSKYPASHYFDIINTTAYLNSTTSPLPDFIISRTTINGSDIIYLNSNASRFFFDTNYLTFYIYYDTLEYTEIEEVVEYNLFQYIADFGGFLGFFTGAGFLTFFESMELIYGAVYPNVD